MIVKETRTEGAAFECLRPTSEVGELNLRQEEMLRSLEEVVSRFGSHSRAGGDSFSVGD